MSRAVSLVAGFDVEEGEPLPTGPDLSVLQIARRPAPPFPLDALDDGWATWVVAAARAAAAPVDFVIAPLLAAASVLIGNARWPEAWPGWSEPPVLWCVSVGEPGSGKSPGSDALLRHIIPELERRAAADFPLRLREHQAASEAHKASRERWEQTVRAATKDGQPAPLPPDAPPLQPQEPRIRLSDATIEAMAQLLANTAPKGLLLTRDEIAGLILGMDAYREGGRAFYIEGNGGRPFRVERVKAPQPIFVAHLAFALWGGTQPEKLTELMAAPDDGLLSRIAWVWPEEIRFGRSRIAPDIAFAIEALDNLRQLEMAPALESGGSAQPIKVPLTDAAAAILEDFAQRMSVDAGATAGLLRSSYAKARGHALRLSLVLELMRWAAEPGNPVEPREVGERALLSACNLVEGYFLPMAARCFGDSQTPATQHHAVTLARWIAKTRPAEVHVRELLRKVRLPGLSDAASIHAACGELCDADWLLAPERGSQNGRAKSAYPIAPGLWSALDRQQVAR